MSDPISPASARIDQLDLEPIKARAEKTRHHALQDVATDVVRLVDRDIPALIREVEELRAAVRPQPCPSCAQMRDDSDREFIEQKWRAGVRAAEYGDGDECPYELTSLAGTWWLRGYESTRAVPSSSSLVVERQEPT